MELREHMHLQADNKFTRPNFPFTNWQFTIKQMSNNIRGLAYAQPVETSTLR